MRNYEVASHIAYQNKLYLSSDNYIRNQSEKFVDNETGFFKLWSEAFSFFESDTEKNARWKSRLEKYFRTTEYISYIEANTNQYSITINKQREELLGKLHFNNKNLVIKNKDVRSVGISNNNVAKVIEKVNALVLMEVIPEVIEALLVPFIISFLLIFFGIILAPFTAGIIFVVGLIFSIWQSNKFSNELESQINESFKLADKEHLLILPELQKNTTAYYKELNKKIKR
ncbi:hypothetical protein LNJ05_00670 [Tenacibaculum finnmarkense genomovar ulcerans]|uniref:hypothetical protein n=1 Tax=Tenacibaculum finnmarkense TaxID=2781243 RepID=UPI001E605FD2|nr:hypothetical protein [Tenacibaculum finnmarkense]MCD8431278.1 hypothetical protein [Tenacibaculum finnmarkense genomovar ulcerans]